MPLKNWNDDVTPFTGTIGDKPFSNAAIDASNPKIQVDPLHKQVPLNKREKAVQRGANISLAVVGVIAATGLGIPAAATLGFKPAARIIDTYRDFVNSPASVERYACKDATDKMTNGEGSAVRTVGTRTAICTVKASLANGPQ